MARLWSAKLKELTILGRMNDVNIQAKYELDIPEGVSSIDAIKLITATLHAAGLEPPVSGSKQAFRTTAEKAGATGQHPDELTPRMGINGKQEACPNCGKPIYTVSGVTKKKDSPNFGKAWSKWFCPKARGGCGAYNFGDRKDVRFD